MLEYVVPRVADCCTRCLTRVEKAKVAEENAEIYPIQGSSAAATIDETMEINEELAVGERDVFRRVISNQPIRQLRADGRL